MKRQWLNIVVAVLMLGLFFMPQIASADIHVDDQDSGFEKQGKNWYTKNVGHNSKMQYTYANGSTLECWGQWNFPVADAGAYEVQAFIPRDGATSKKASYQICYNGETTSVVVDQSKISDEWVSLGIYYFKEGSGQYVKLGDNTGESATAKLMVGYDTVRLVPRNKLLVQSPDKIYWLQNARVYHITSFEIINEMKKAIPEWGQGTYKVPGLMCHLGKEFASKDPSSDGLLIKDVTTGKCYVIEQQKKRYLSSMDGYDWADVISVSGQIADIWLDVPPPACNVQITSASVNPVQVVSGGICNCSVSASSSEGHALSYYWTSTGGSFDDCQAQHPRWFAPQNEGNSAVNYELTVRVTCSKCSKSESKRVTVMVQPKAVPFCSLSVSSAYGQPSPANGTHQYQSGTAITAQADSPVSGGSGIRYVCTGWKGSGSVPNGYETTVTFTISTESSLQWNWKTQYQLTTSSSIGGRVSKVMEGGLYQTSNSTSMDWYDDGKTVTLTVIPESGYEFSHWSGDFSGTATTATIQMNGAKNVTANFKPTSSTPVIPSSDKWYLYQGKSGSDNPANMKVNCGPVCVAMAIKLVKKQNVLFPSIRKVMKAANGATTNCGQIGTALDKWGIAHQSVKGLEGIKAAIARGHIVICALTMGNISKGEDIDGKSDDPDKHFRRYYSYSDGHFVIARGISEDGKYIIVCDPNVWGKPPYSKYWYSNGQPKGRDRYYDAQEFTNALQGENSAIEIVGLKNGGGDGLPAPTVTTVSPDSGTNTGSITVTIHGNNFQEGIEVRLIKDEDTVIWGETTTISEATISTTFDLKDAATGTWSVVVTNLEGQSATLTDGFVVVEKPTNPGTEVKGVISESTTWNVAGSPYIVTGNVLVGSEVTLTIEPGVEIRFDGPYCLQVEGTLKAIGAPPSDMIVFTLNNGSSSVRWGGIKFNRKGKDNLQQIEYALIEYAGTGISYDAGSSEKGTATRAVFSHNEIEHCSTGIYLDYTGDYPEAVRVEHNSIQQNTIGVNGYVYAGATIAFNTISSNEECGVCIGWSLSKVNIEHNVITDNGTSSVNDGSGIKSFGHCITVNNNNIYNNCPYDFYSYRSNSEYPMDANNNWWGTANINDIEKHIYGEYDAFGRVVLGFQPVLTTPVQSPICHQVCITPGSVTVGTHSIVLTAAISGIGVTSPAITTAECFVDKIGADGTGIKMAAADGLFDSSEEKAVAYISTANWPVGSRTVYIHAKTEDGWGSFGKADILVAAGTSCAPATISIIPALKRVDVGATVSVSIQVQGATGLTGTETDDTEPGTNSAPSNLTLTLAVPSPQSVGSEFWVDIRTGDIVDMTSLKFTMSFDHQAIVR